MNKIVLINGGALKNRVVKRVLAGLFPDQDLNDFQIIEPNSISGASSSEGVHIISKEDCISLMRGKIDNAMVNNPDASFFIFMRGRFDEIPATKDRAKMMEECALVLVKHNSGVEAYSQAASFEVPEEIAELVREGVSFSKAVEQITKKEGVKEGSGFVGILTKNIVSKEEQYFQPLAIAFSTCLNKIAF